MRAVALVALVGLVLVGGCPDTRTRTQTTHGGSTEPARVAPPKPSHHHSSHEHPHGAHPHPRGSHHHHPHPHPHLDGVKGHHHPY